MTTPLDNTNPVVPDPIDTVTILWTQPDKLATKQFSRISPKSAVTKKQYDAGYLYKVPEPIGISCIEELSAVLTFVERQPQALIIRGTPVSADIIGQSVQRTGSGEGADFAGNFKTPAQGRYYIEIDVDKLPMPSGWKVDQVSISKVCEHIIHLLPPEFHEASYHWQLSSSAGVLDKSTVSAHFWFWLVQPVPDATLKTWAKHVNAMAGIKLIDPALFQHVQPHYVAAPLFHGMPDPFPVRSGLVTKSLDRVDLQLPTPAMVPQSTTTPPSGTFSTNGGSGFDYHMGRIGDHPGGDGFHNPIVQAAASYVSEHGADGTDVEALFLVIQQRALTADTSNHRKGDVEDRASREHIVSAITSALRKYGDATNQRRKTRRLVGLTPEPHDGYQDVATIQANIDAILDEVFVS